MSPAHAKPLPIQSPSHGPVLRDKGITGIRGGRGGRGRGKGEKERERRRGGGRGGEGVGEKQ